MKNFGLSDWAWVQPAFEDLAPAARLAVHAEELLEGAVRADSLEAAVADCSWVVGTSSRHREGKRRLSPREFATHALERGRTGKVALVFGEERSGMSNAEIDFCHALSAVPTLDAQPSINLAQAVLLYSYELRLAALEATPPPPAPEPRAATDADLRALEAGLSDALKAGGFLVQPNRHGVRDLLQVLLRGRPSQREARLWNAALRAMAKRRD